MSLLIKMSEATCIALHLLAYIASKGTLVNAQDLAKACGASEGHTMKVCQRLTKAGILGARRGPGGGFLLERNAQDIRLLDVYSLFDGPLPSGHCVFATPACSEGDIGQCIFGGKMRDINRQIVEYLHETKLSDIAAKCHKALVAVQNAPDSP